MKKIIDKTIYSIFIILCIIGFFSLIDILPKLFLYFFHIDLHNNKGLIFFFLIFILGRSIQLIEEEQEEYIKKEKEKIIALYSKNQNRNSDY